MATYIVGDIHGCFREWIKFKSKIEKQDTEAEFILVGDILDKGPNSFEMLQWAIKRIYVGSKYHMVIGNHETEKWKWLQYILKNTVGEEWKNPEIARKMLSTDGFGFYRVCCEKNLTRQQLTEILNWLETLPEYIEKEITTTKGTQKFVVTHYKLQSDQKVMVNYIVIHGHRPTTLEPCKSAGAIPGKIWIQDKDINVDCGLVYGVSKSKGLYGDLAAIRLEDLQEFYYYNHYNEFK